jgi:hypothetical protein
MGASRSELLLENVCAFDRLFWYLLWFNVSFLLLGGFASLYVTGDSPGAVVLKVNIVINVAMILFSGTTVLYCRSAG